mgnify:CR=1 FL=1
MSRVPQMTVVGTRLGPEDPATFAARRLDEMAHNTAAIIGIELLAACGLKRLEVTSFVRAAREHSAGRLPQAASA